MRLYLSGGMEFKENLGKEWRQQLTKNLKMIGYEVFDPVQCELTNPIAKEYDWKKEKLSSDLSEFRKMVRQEMFVPDMKGIQTSDIVILLYDESVRRGAGSLAEAWEAFREAKPLYLITKYSYEEIPGWLIGETTAIFGSVEELIIYLSDKNKSIRDIQEARYVKEKYLGDIYIGG